MRGDGTAASKAAATSCSAASTAMNVTTFNAQTFSAGDVIDLCDTGGNFKDASFVIPSSGSSGNPITLTNSGSPVINGATLLGNSWTATTSGYMTSDANTVALYDFNGNLNDSGSNGYNLTAGGTATYAAGYYGQALQPGSYPYYPTVTPFNFGTSSFTIQAWVYLASGSAASGALFTKGAAGLARYEMDIVRNGASTSFTAFYYDGANNPVVTYSPGNANLFNNAWHHIAMRVDLSNQIDHNLSLWIDGVEEGTPVTLAGVGSADNTYNFTIGNRSPGGYPTFIPINQVKVSNIAVPSTAFPTSPGAQPNTWQYSLTTQPNILLLNRAAGVLEGSSTTLSAAGQWFWASNVLYLNAASNPYSAYVSPGVEAPTRGYCIDTNGKSYLTIQNLTILGCNYHGIAFTASDSNVNITGNTITLNGDTGVEAENLVVATNVLIDSNTLSWNGGNGVLAMKGPNNWTVQRNTVLHNCQNNGTTINVGTQNPYDWQFCGGIRFWEEWTDNTSTLYNIDVERNSSSYNGQYADGSWVQNGTYVGGVGIWFDVIDDATGGNVIRWNNAFENAFAEIQMEHNQHVQVYGNLAHDSPASLFTVGIFVTDSIHGGDRFSGYNTIVNNIVYNNSSYGIRNEGAQTPTAGTSINNTFTNNISYGNALNQLAAVYGGQNDGTDGYGNTYTYNSFGNAATNFILWSPTLTSPTQYSTYATWEAASGNCGTTGCSHSIQTSPTFVSVGTGNFAPATGSSAVGSGLSISGYGVFLLPGASWPASVTLGQQAPAWNIGAYVTPGSGAFGYGITPNGINPAWLAVQ
jgi:hypothetical protein